MQQARPLLSTVPELAARLIDAAEAIGRKDVADQLRGARIRSVTYDADIDAGYIYVTESRPLNAVEQNMIGVKHGECVTLDALPGTVVIDLDNFARVKGIELLGHSDVFRLLGPAA